MATASRFNERSEQAIPAVRSPQESLVAPPTVILPAGIGLSGLLTLSTSRS